MFVRWIGWRCRLVAVLMIALSSVVAARIAVGQPGAATDVVAPAAAAGNASSDPRAVERFRAAAALQNRELYDLAATQWAALRHDYPRDPFADRATFQRGICLFQLEQFENAVTEFRRLVDKRQRLDPELAEQCFAYLGLAQYNLGRVSEGKRAAESLDAAIETLNEQLKRFANGPLAPESAFYRGEALYARGRLDAASSAYRATLKQYPQHARRAELLHALGVAEQEQGRYEQATASLGQFIAEFPQHDRAADARLRRADALYAMPGRRTESVAAYAAVASKHADEASAPQAAYMAAYAALEVGDIYAASKYATRFLDRYPNHDLAADVRQVAAEVALQQGAYAEAARAYHNLLAEYPRHADRDAWTVRRAHSLMLAGSCGEAIAILEPSWQAIADRTVRAEAAFVLGNSYLKFGRAAEAVPVLTASAALPRWPQSDDVLVTLATAQHASGNTAAAIGVLDNFFSRLKTREGEPNPWEGEAKIREGEAKIREGEAKIREGEAPAEPNAGNLFDRALVLRGELHVAAENPIAALADFARLLADRPESPLVPQALLARARVQFSEQQLAAAEASLDRLLESHKNDPLAPEALLLRAAVRKQRGDFTGGIADADAFLATDPSRPKRSDALYTRGLCEVGLGKPTTAAETFSRLVQTDPQYRALDRVLYDLAWAYQEAGDAAEAIATFAKLAESHPDSPLAAESFYRVGESQYAADDFSAAAKSFWSAGRRATEPELLERSLHKLAWSCFEQQQFEAAEEAFDKQVADHPDGELAADAVVMIGECRYQRQEFATAIDSFGRAFKQPSGHAALRELAMLHAGQSAAQLKRWERSLELLDLCLREFPRGKWSSEVRYERGWALYHLERFDEAQQLFESVAADNAGVLGARSEFMVGEVLFAQRQFDDAVRKFFQVAYGYGDVDAPEPYRHWQAEAMFEAARCLEETKRHDSARRLYQELLERHPASAKAAYARRSLEEIKRR